MLKLAGLQNSVDSVGLDYSSSAPSMPSFAFLSPISVVEPRSRRLEFSTNKSDVNEIVRHSPLYFGDDVKEMDRKRGTNGHKALGFHSKRNWRIGLGECEQLDLVVTESVISWSSCTQLPTSLRSSLVY